MGGHCVMKTKIDLTGEMVRQNNENVYISTEVSNSL